MITTPIGNKMVLITGKKKAFRRCRMTIKAPICFS